VKVVVDGEALQGNVIRDVEKDRKYNVEVEVPRAKKSGTNGNDEHI
jgi:hypothetical protein